MKRKYLYAVGGILLFLAACSPSAKQKAAELSKLETEIAESSNKQIADTLKVKQVMADYRYYTSHFPDDSLAPGYMFTLAKLYFAVHQNDSAIYFFDKVYHNYPAYHKRAIALFTEAYIYNNEKHAIGKAAQLYKEYLEKFPNTPMAASAQKELETLGKTPEQILMEMDSLHRLSTDSLKAKK